MESSSLECDEEVAIVDGLSEVQMFYLLNILRLDPFSSLHSPLAFALALLYAFNRAMEGAETLD